MQLAPRLCFARFGIVKLQQSDVWAVGALQKQLLQFPSVVFWSRTTRFTNNKFDAEQTTSIFCASRKRCGGWAAYWAAISVGQRAIHFIFCVCCGVADVAANAAAAEAATAIAACAAAKARQEYATDADDVGVLCAAAAAAAACARKWRRCCCCVWRQRCQPRCSRT